MKPLEANLSKRMECEMVSKAVVRSRRMNRLSFVILTNPTSVLCKRQNKTGIKKKKRLLLFM